MLGGLSYPGATAEWGLLWTQNVLLILVQFTTAAALFTQDGRYVPVPWPGDRGGPSRRTVLSVHAASGFAVIAANLLFMAGWLSGRGTGGALATPLLTVPAVVLTLALLAMGATGVSLYAHARPTTRFPTWRFGYAVSRKIHRAAFVVIVATLGVHLFLTLRVSEVWTGWIEASPLWGSLVLGTAVVWGVLAGLVLLMVTEWMTGDLFSKWGWTDDARVALVGGAVGAAIAGAATMDLAAVLVGASVVLFATGAVALLYARDPRL